MSLDLRISWSPFKVALLLCALGKKLEISIQLYVIELIMCWPKYSAHFCIELTRTPR